MGKGDTRRPMQISAEEWRQNYERIFGPPKEPKEDSVRPTGSQGPKKASQ